MSQAHPPAAARPGPKAQALRMMKETFELTEQEQQMVDSEPPMSPQFARRTGAPVELEESEDDDFSSDPRSSRRT